MRFSFYMVFVCYHESLVWLSGFLFFFNISLLPFSLILCWRQQVIKSAQAIYLLFAFLLFISADCSRLLSNHCLFEYLARSIYRFKHVSVSLFFLLRTRCSLFSSFFPLQVEVSDPECREVCQKAYDILLKKGDVTSAHVSKLSNAESLAPVFTTALAGNATKVPAGVLSFVCELAFSLVDVKVYEADAWANTLSPYLVPYVGTDVAAAVVDAVCLVILF